MSQTAICYARKSVVLKGRIAPSSPERQQTNTNDKATELGLTPENYTDAEGHRSGRSEDARPEWRKARARLTGPDVAALVVDTWDRAARNVRLLLELVDECERLSVRFISCHDAIDTRTAQGRFQLSIIASVGEFESNVAGERQSATADYLRRTKGRYIGWPPFGSERVKTETDYTLLPSTKLQPNGTDHQALTHLYELRLRESFSTDSMAAKMNAEDWRFRDRRGQLGFWNGDRVRGVIRNHWTYAGYVVVGQSHRGDYEIIPGSHAPLLPESLTGPVAAGFGWRARGRRTRESLDHPLTGLLICGECGERLTGEFRRGRIAYRHIVHLGCSLPYRLDGAVLEAAVREHVAGLRLPSELEQESALSVTRALLA
ncbi:MAG: recombinase family protein [Sulfuricaulis sp.]|nr:recombinase family protein [Sulfuricaulis sp.]